MLNWPIPKGLDKALDEMEDEEKEDVEMEDVEREPLEKGEETEWRPGMRLTTAHPSWMWKNNRKDLASRENRNKAGKKRGAGTTSQNRAARRAVEQPRKNEEYWGSQVQQNSNPWQRDEGWWEDGWWSDPWKRDDSWWADSWHREDNPWEREEGDSASSSGHRREDNPWEREEGDTASSSGHRRRMRPRRRRSQSAGSQGSQGSVSQTGSEGTGRSPQRKNLVWRKKELEVERKTWLDAHEKKLEEIPEDDKPFTTMLKEIAEKRGKSKPLEKGPEAAAPPLEKGSETTPAPLEKGSLVETKTEASASNAAPLVVDKGFFLNPDTLWTIDPQK